MSDVVTVDRSVITWLLGAAGTLVMFLLGLGVKDLRDKMRKVDQLCLELRDLKSDLRKGHAELHGEIGILSQRLDSELDK